MKKFYFVLVVLTLVFSMSLGTSLSVFADEQVNADTSTDILTENSQDEDAEIDNSSSQETIIDEESTIEKLKQTISELLAKVNSLNNSDNYFVDKVLPYLINGLIDLILVAILLAKPFFKSKARAKQLEGYAQALQSDKENLTELLSSTDAPAIQKAITEIFDNYITNTITLIREEFSSYMTAYSGLKSTIETSYAQIKALIAAARQAWASKPEVVALLAEAPEKSILEKQVHENESLKNYIRSIKGEEAEEIIKSCEVV